MQMNMEWMDVCHCCCFLTHSLSLSLSRLFLRIMIFKWYLSVCLAKMKTKFNELVIRSVFFLSNGCVSAAGDKQNRLLFIWVDLVERWDDVGVRGRKKDDKNVSNVLIFVVDS